MNDIKRFGSPSSEVQGFDSLTELALNMRWSWNHEADQLWKELDPDLWNLTRNPWVVLQTVSREQLERKMKQPSFRDKIGELMNFKEKAASLSAWFQQNYVESPLTNVAYF